MSMNSGQRISRHVRVALALNAVIAALLWLAFVSHGFVAQGVLDSVYEIQAYSLARGSLAIVPGLDVLFHHDMMIHRGLSYFYQGLVPSILFMALKPVVGRVAASYAVVFAFFFTLIFFLQKLILDLMENTKRSAGRSPWETCLSAVVLTWLVLFVVAYPVERRWFFGRFIIYEQQIIFGLALALPSMYFAVQGIRERSTLPIAVSAFFLGLASATRPSWFVLAAVAVPAATIWMYYSRRLREVPPAAWVMIGTALMLAASPLALNYVRYGSPLDFGTSYQNPGDPEYLRVLKAVYSPETRAWNVVFNALAFYFPMPLTQYPSLFRNSLSLWAEYPPGLFYFNPQFIPMLILVPPAFVLGWKERSRILPALFVLAVIATYMNALLLVYAKAVLVRFFIEFYYPLMLLFVAGLAMFLRPAFVVLILALCLAPYIPSTARGFATGKPMIMTVDPDANFADTSPRRTPQYLVKNPIWPVGWFSAAYADRMRLYNAMGVAAFSDGSLRAKDLFAVYVVPRPKRSSGGPATLVIQGLQSLEHPGTVRFCIDDRFVGESRVDPFHTVDCAFSVPSIWLGQGPSQVLGVFYIEGTRFLPGREPKGPVVAFRELKLE
ncbi:MAG: hypothetical protein LDL33_01675 [Desulfomonile sp.]|nr:hypothetical protein [Desulfomonile sp.]